jgi:hypothetical protein
MAPPPDSDPDRSKDFSSYSTIETFVGRSIVLSNDEVDEYRELMDSVRQEFHPATFGEQWRAQGIVDGEWRLRRNIRVEKGFYLLGEREFGGEFAHETDLEIRANLIKNRLLQVRGKQLKQITQHTKWLRKQLEKDIAELLAMQNERHRPTRHGIHAVPKRRAS